MLSRNGRRPAIAVSAFLLAAVSAIRLHGQAVDANAAPFEVASIKENKSGETRWTYDMRPGGRFKATSVSLVNLISIAYGNPSPLPGFLVVGGPDWIRTKRFDLVAKADGNPAKDHFPLMLRALLAERFDLHLRSEMRERETFALVMARIDGRLGPRLRRTDLDCTFKGDRPPAAAEPASRCSDRNYQGKVTSTSMTMPVLARFLMMWVEDRRDVLDKTGLTGSFEVTLEWTPNRVAPVPLDAPGEVGRAAAAIDPNGPSLFTAVQEQLGLRLEPRKEPVEVLIVDRAQQPMTD
jgi:uncharacterized protein (TIGR03435 family)